MQRKIIAQGLGGRTIFLPIQWVRDHNLEAGDEITLLEKGSNLVLSAQRPAQRKIALNLSSSQDKSIRIQLQNVYRLGYDQIIIQYANVKQRGVIQNLVDKHFIGFEIIREKANSLTINTIAESSSTSYESILERIFHIIAETFKEVDELFDKHNNKKKESITEYVQKVTRYDNFLRRTINTKKIFEEKAHLYWSLCGYLHLIQRNLLHLSEQYKSSQKISPKARRLFFNLQMNFIELKKGYLSNKADHIDQVSERVNAALEKDFLSYLSSCPASERKIVYYYAELCRLLYLLSYPLYGIIQPNTSEY